MDRQIHVSEIESAVYSLRVGRAGILENFDPVCLAREIRDGAYDIVRMRLPLDDPGVFRKLEALEMPRHIFKMMVRMTAPCLDDPGYYESRLSFRRYDGSQRAELDHMLRDFFLTDTEKGFENTFFDHFIGWDKTVESSYRYYQAIYEKSLSQPAIHCYIGYYEGRCVGFASFEIINGVSEGILFSVLTEYRKSGFGFELLRAARMNGFLHGSSALHTDVILQNAASIQTHIRNSFKPLQTYMNVILYPMLSATPFRQFEVRFSSLPELLEQTGSVLAGSGFAQCQVAGVAGDPLPAGTFSATGKLFVVADKPLLITADVKHIGRIFYIYLK